MTEKDLKQKQKDNDLISDLFAGPMGTPEQRERVLRELRKEKEEKEKKGVVKSILDSVFKV